MKDTDVAYCAGFFDGEGSITFRKIRLKNGDSYGVLACAGNTDRDVLEFVRSLFGGRIKLNNRKWITKGRKPCYVLRMNTTSAIPFLVAIRPYLHVKAERADLAIEYAETRYRTKTVPVSEIQRRSQFRERLLVLNHRGI